MKIVQQINSTLPAIFIILLFIGGCETKEDISQTEDAVLFTMVNKAESGIEFNNTLVYNEDFNIYTYRNFYNGGGVGLGDINNDGLIDIYFTANMGKNKLYLNKGNFEFEDISDKAGIGGEKAWSTGVSMADVNGDGWLDIYVCNSGDVKGDNKQNELFINNGDLTFSEQAASYGLDDKGFSTHMAFFDYDKDGDLDAYLLNNSFQAIGSFNLRQNLRPVRDEIGGDKLFRNDDGKFVDVSTASGIYGSVIGFGLGVTVGDLNNDGWQDIYISNDFFEKDYLYLNNGDGTFSEVLEEGMRSISAASMGADMADFNNDAHPDIFVTDMLPEDDAKLKQVTTFENWDKYQYNVENGYYNQFIRNMLHLNNGDGTFSEIGRLAGVEATDWSWGALIFDMDNDGLKDLFVSNGIFQDLTDLDYINFISNEETQRAIITKQGVNFKSLIDSIPSRPIPNYAFKNAGNFQFIKNTEAWGLGTPSHSNGSAYGDLDNDGDLDLVVSNVNSDAFIYRNESNHKLPDHHFLQFELKGKQKNTFAFGTKIIIKDAEGIFYIEQMPMRGFQSSVDPRPLLGLGSLKQLDSVIVQWPDNTYTILTDVATDQKLMLDQNEGKAHLDMVGAKSKSPLLKDVTGNYGNDFYHEENLFVDFKRDPMIYHMLSTMGPKVISGDINNDGNDDFYLGGAKGFPGQLFISDNSGRYSRSATNIFDDDKNAEDIDGVFFDADLDGDLDLFVASGGTEYGSSSMDLRDRLYINQGSGQFEKSSQPILKENKFSTGTVTTGDYDNDGDLDLFVGARFLNFVYGVPVNGYIYNNNGKGEFEDVTSFIAPALNQIGMITDAEWVDIDQDNDLDLMISTEWGHVHYFNNNNGIFTDSTEGSGLELSNGWWNGMASGDFDNDGDIDFILGNHGLNSRFRASKEQPLKMYVNDFDQNGTVEQLICRSIDGKNLPFVLKHNLVTQLPSLKKKYLHFNDFANQGIEDIFTKEQLENAVVSTTNELASSIAINEGNGKFKLMELPIETQFAPVYGLLVDDFNKDGNLDVLVGGNFFESKPEVGRYDANYGLVLLGKGDNSFTAVLPRDSGFAIDGQVRDIKKLDNQNGSLIVVAKNKSKLQFFQNPLTGHQ